MKDLRQLSTYLAGLPAEELADFLVGILSPGELEQVFTRLEIINLLKKGVAQHQIAEKLGVGVATVSRGQKMLQAGYFKTLEPWG